MGDFNSQIPQKFPNPIVTTTLHLNLTGNKGLFIGTLLMCHVIATVAQNAQNLEREYNSSQLINGTHMADAISLGTQVVTENPRFSLSQFYSEYFREKPVTEIPVKLQEATRELINKMRKTNPGFFNTRGKELAREAKDILKRIRAILPRLPINQQVYQDLKASNLIIELALNLDAADESLNKKKESHSRHLSSH